MSQYYKDLMIDIETLGTRNNSAILSIAAVQFNIENGDIGEEYHENISLKNCQDRGLSIDAETLEWWLRQDYQVLVNCLQGGLPLSYVLIELKQMFGKRTNVWANSPNFDCRILINAYEAVNVEAPWRYYQERDVRTLMSLAPEVKESTEFKGNKHNPLDDCHYQIECVHKAYKKLTA